MLLILFPFCSNFETLPNEFWQNDPKIEFSFPFIPTSRSNLKLELETKTESCGRLAGLIDDSDRYRQIGSRNGYDLIADAGLSVHQVGQKGRPDVAESAELRSRNSTFVELSSNGYSSRFCAGKTLLLCSFCIIHIFDKFNTSSTIGEVM